jgi:hypothetical protein
MIRASRLVEALFFGVGIGDEDGVGICGVLENFATS